MKAVRILPQRVGWLGFDLAEVMGAVGPRDELTWRLVDADLVPSDAASAERWQALTYESRLPGGATLTWADMAELARTCEQVVRGTFTGFGAKEPLVQLAAVDGRCWIVSARDQSILDQVRSAFVGVEDCEQPAPHW